ncbi:MAG TPA: hypothetical protein VN177_07985, partial [Myxococcales bacterium]|nr:hypothetical protein [Myxococcales bacterium]
MGRGSGGGAGRFDSTGRLVADAREGTSAADAAGIGAGEAAAIGAAGAAGIGAAGAAGTGSRSSSVTSKSSSMMVCFEAAGVLFATGVAGGSGDLAAAAGFPAELPGAAVAGLSAAGSDAGA